MNIFNWIFGDKTPPALPVERREGYFSIAPTGDHPRTKAINTITGKIQNLIDSAPVAVKEGSAQDDNEGEIALKQTLSLPNVGPVLLEWYATQGFIGHQMCAILAQHWLIDKACSMPGRDAIRNGYNVVSADGEELAADTSKLIQAYDKKFRLNYHMEQFVRMGRIFGIRVAIFKVESTDSKYYEKPFNIDGVTKNSYKGIVQVDPYWCAPLLDGVAASKADTSHFYEPTWWMIAGKKYHRSHLIIFRNSDPPDLLKPSYMYGGIPVPQRIMERVYGAERTANEAPQLVQTKRSTIFGTDMAQFAANSEEATKRLQEWVEFRDNYAVKLMDKEADSVEQFDTSLADLDAVIMSQYQIVAAAADVPATKLLGTQPKGFNSSGDYEEKVYHEELESIQTHVLSPFADRHHALVMRSYVAPEQNIPPVDTEIAWLPLDVVSAKEQAEINEIKSRTGINLVNSGAITGTDELERVATDKDSGYAGLKFDEPPEELIDGI